MKSPFRGIRMKLFNEGKLLRYLGYAIGEIALIIIGIMMALQLNNWNEDRKAQVEFDAYIVQLREDVRTAIGRAEAVVKSTQENAARDYKIIQFLDDKEDNDPALETFEDALDKIMRATTLNVRIGNLGPLLNGDFQLIGRDEVLGQQALKLQSDLLAYFGTIEKIIEGRRFSMNIVRGYVILSNRLVPEVELSYNLEQMKSSTEFIYAIHSLSKSKTEYHFFANEIVNRLSDFLTVLEEYE